MPLFAHFENRPIFPLKARAGKALAGGWQPRLFPMLLLLATPSLAGAQPTDNETFPAAIPLALLERTIDQDRIADTLTRDHQGCWLYWRVDYRLRNNGDRPLEVVPAEITATVDGWLSNSRVPSHAVPRFASHTIAGSAGLATTTAVVASEDLSHDCKEHAVLYVWPETSPGPVTPHAPGEPQREPPFTLAPGESLRARLILEHRHFLHGPYEPLLGNRVLELRIGPATFRDELPLDQPLHVAQAPTTWNDLPVERLDPRHFISPPDSLYLAADISGRTSFEFPERPIRYGTPMRLSFWYLIAPGTQGACRFEIRQFREAPKSYKVLSDGRQEGRLTVVGRWTKFEHIYRTEPEANLLKLRFAIESTNIGEMWIDDVTLEPLDARQAGP